MRKRKMTLSTSTQTILFLPREKIIVREGRIILVRHTSVLGVIIRFLKEINTVLAADQKLNQYYRTAITAAINLRAKIDIVHIAAILLWVLLRNVSTMLQQSFIFLRGKERCHQIYYQ